ncbi:MAG: hypothetical protein R3236_11325, partial [Phycisphaeraceae bacterium]|nr:hypothetical protein [Phycisphaeraceae bacterium]
GDVIADLLMRIQLEKVGGEFQGSVVAHLKGNGLSKGVNRLTFDQKGRLWVGLTNRGWAKGQKGLQVVTFGGKAGQTIHSIGLAKDGFIVRFTQPVSEVKAEQVEVERWVYQYTNRYNAGKRQHEKNLAVKSVQVAPDKKSVHIAVDLKTDHVYGIKLKNLGLKHDTGYYTLNRLR